MSVNTENAKHHYDKKCFQCPPPIQGSEYMRLQFIIIINLTQETKFEFSLTTERQQVYNYMIGKRC